MFHVPEKYRVRYGIMKSSETFGNNGWFEFPYKTDHVRAMASDGLEWDHVSITLARKCIPNWDIMCYVKDVFWDDEDTVIQFHPPKSQYVNNHPYCLHLWKSHKQEIILPDRSMVGIK